MSRPFLKHTLTRLQHENDMVVYLSICGFSFSFINLTYSLELTTDIVSSSFSVRNNVSRKFTLLVFFSHQQHTHFNNTNHNKNTYPYTYFSFKVGLGSTKDKSVEWMRG